MKCHNVFANRRVSIHHLLKVHGQTLPYAGHFLVDLGPEDLRRRLQQLHDNQQRRPTRRTPEATREAPSAAAGGPGQGWEAPRGVRTRQHEPALTPDQGPWVVMNHWPRIDELRTRRVTSREPMDTVGLDAPLPGT